MLDSNTLSVIRTSLIIPVCINFFIVIYYFFKHDYDNVVEKESSKNIEEKEVKLTFLESIFHISEIFMILFLGLLLVYLYSFTAKYFIFLNNLYLFLFILFLCIFIFNPQKMKKFFSIFDLKFLNELCCIFTVVVSLIGSYASGLLIDLIEIEKGNLYVDIVFSIALLLLIISLLCTILFTFQNVFQFCLIKIPFLKRKIYGVSEKNKTQEKSYLKFEKWLSYSNKINIKVIKYMLTSIVFILLVLRSTIMSHLNFFIAVVKIPLKFVKSFLVKSVVKETVIDAMYFCLRLIIISSIVVVYLMLSEEGRSQALLDGYEIILISMLIPIITTALQSKENRD